MSQRVPAPNVMSAAITDRPGAAKVLVPKNGIGIAFWIAGVPGRVRRELTDEEVAGLRANAAHYVENARIHAGAIPTPAVLLAASTDPGRAEGTT